MFLGFCCWLTPITPTVLCVSTCSGGLLDFHIPKFGFLVESSMYWVPVNAHCTIRFLVVSFACQVARGFGQIATS